MGLRRLLRPAAAGAILLFASGAATPLQGGLTALGGIERGQWQLRQADGSVRKLCLTAPAALLQLRHPGLQCRHVVVENSAERATVRYDCPGRGYGQTTVSVETARLVDVQTSGIVDGMPFQDEYEGRKLGPCG